MKPSKIQYIKADLCDPQHGSAIVELLNLYALDPMGGGSPLPEKTREQLPSALAKRHDCHVILARDGARWAGLCNCFEGFSTFACQPLLNIHDVYVREDYRGFGIAQGLIGAAEDVARGLGCCKLTLEVLSKNLPARRAYAKLDFEPYRLDERFGHAEFWEKKINAELPPG